MQIDYAEESDYDYLRMKDKHIAESLILPKIKAQEIWMIRVEDQIMGWMRYNYFWDHIPFMNMIWIEEPYRDKGIGKKVVLYWEGMMQDKGFQMVMTSTLSNENAQHFYRRLGYKDVGCLLLENEPLEVILIKKFR